MNNAVEKHEQNITRKILSDRNRRRCIWQHIRSLQGENKISKKEIQLYNETGEKIPDEKIKEELENKWRKIYQMRENKIKDSWNSDEKATRYGNKLRNDILKKDKYIKYVGHENGIYTYKYEEINYPPHLQEYMDYLLYKG